MANRFSIDRYWSLLKGVTLIRARVLLSGTTPLLQKWNYPTLNSGALGSYANAATSGGGAGGFGDAAGTEGVLTVARTGAGLWTVTLQDQFQRLLDISFHGSIAGGTSNILACHENTTISNMSAASGSILGVALLSSTGTAADPTASSSITLSFLLQNATVG